MDMMEPKEARYYRALYQVAVKINSVTDTRKLLNAIAESTAQAVHAKAASIMLLSPDHQELNHSSAYGLSDWYVRKGPVKADQSIADALKGHSVVILDAGSDSRVQYRSQAVKEGIVSILCVPIRLRGEIIGVMRVYTGERRQFSSADIEFVEAVANLGAIALENAYRYEEIRDKYDAAREDMLRWFAAWT